MLTIFNKNFSILKIRNTDADIVCYVRRFLVVVEFSTMEMQADKCR